MPVGGVNKAVKRSEILDKVNSIAWYHSIDLGVCVTPGSATPEQQNRIAEQIPQDLSGKTVLDIGAWDGYYSFLAEQRGAKRVVAIDPFTFRGGEASRIYRVQSIKGFEIAKEALKSNVEYYIMDVIDLDELEGDFDVVFFFGVYYHLPDPILGFDKACSKCKELLLVEGDAFLSPLSAMLYDFLEEDKSRAWRFTCPLLFQMLWQRGFNNIVEGYFDKTAPIKLGTVYGPPQIVQAGRLFLRCWRE